MPVLTMALLLAAQATNEYSDLYDRIVADAKEGRPILVTIYVALCDAEHQGVVIGKYPRIW